MAGHNHPNTRRPHSLRALISRYARDLPLRARDSQPSASLLRTRPFKARATSRKQGPPSSVLHSADVPARSADHHGRHSLRRAFTPATELDTPRLTRRGAEPPRHRAVPAPRHRPSPAFRLGGGLTRCSPVGATRQTPRLSPCALCASHAAHLRCPASARSHAWDSPRRRSRAPLPERRAPSNVGRLSCGLQLRSPTCTASPPSRCFRPCRPPSPRSGADLPRSCAYSPSRSIAAGLSGRRSPSTVALCDHRLLFETTALSAETLSWMPSSIAGQGSTHDISALEHRDPRVVHGTSSSAIFASGETLTSTSPRRQRAFARGPGQIHDVALPTASFLFRAPAMSSLGCSCTLRGQPLTPRRAWQSRRLRRFG